MNVYLLPYIGATYQGYANLGGNQAVIGVWTDKASRAEKPPVKALLVEPEPMKVGSPSPSHQARKASGGKARNSHPVLSIPGVHIREEIHGRPIFFGDRDG